MSDFDFLPLSKTQFQEFVTDALKGRAQKEQTAPRQVRTETISATAVSEGLREHSREWKLHSDQESKLSRATPSATQDELRCSIHVPAFQPPSPRFQMLSPAEAETSARPQPRSCSAFRKPSPAGQMMSPAEAETGSAAAEIGSEREEISKVAPKPRLAEELQQLWEQAQAQGRSSNFGQMLDPREQGARQRDMNAEKLNALAEQLANEAARSKALEVQVQELLSTVDSTSSEKELQIQKMQADFLTNNQRCHRLTQAMRTVGRALLSTQAPGHIMSIPM